MYHVPNIRLTRYAAEAIGSPIVLKETSGKPPQENHDLKEALMDIKEKHQIEGIAVGAVASRYQYNIVSGICAELGLKVYAPYWQKDHAGLIREAIDAGFEIIFVGVAALGLDDSWLGRRLDHEALDELEKLCDKYGINIGGEGGEYETLVVDGPIFGKRIEILESEKIWDGVRGELVVKKARLQGKKSKKQRE